MIQILIGAGIILLVILFFVVLSGIRFIPNNRIGMIEKRWSGKGSVSGGEQPDRDDRKTLEWQRFC